MKLKENPGVLSFSLKLFAQLVIPINIGGLLPPRTYYAAKLREKKMKERKKKERERERGNKHLITQICRQSGFAVVAYVATTTIWESPGC